MIPNIHFIFILFFYHFVKDYQSYKLTKRNLSTSSAHSDASSYESPNLQIVHNNIFQHTIMNSNSPETKMIHMSQSNGLFL